MSTPPPRRARWSLRARLTVLTAGLLCVALVVGAVVLSTVLSRGRVAALDAVVRARAETVAALVASDQVPDALPVSEPGEIVQVLDGDGRVVATSPTASRTLPVLGGDALADLRARAVRESGVVGGTDASAYDAAARVAVVAPAGAPGGTVVVATVPVAEVEGLVRALRLALAGVVPVLTALFAGAVWVALGRALRPVERLRAAAAQVARAGGPGSLPDPGTDDEVGALARTLNEMLDRLEDAAGRQRAFVADAAHELRTPLAALRAQLEVAAAHPAAYEAGELVDGLGEQVRRMQALVDDLLLLARLGSRPVPDAAVDLGDVAREAVALAVAGAGPAAGGGVAVEVAGVGRARGDAAALGRVVRNLVENALGHAARSVRVEVADGLVAVVDDGPGIPAADRERAFARFVRLDAARARPGGGSGLGLAIAREVAREHGGDVVLGERADGAPGLRAELRLPVARGGAGPAEEGAPPTASGAPLDDPGGAGRRA
ncbi:HAMP domain-containing histidine kinase [Cellulomonas sp. ACRRI]|uniref:sensor histidine kinase n=1 Tax=Cellulomonas sp. ACRRI TaxID=2918188 RepID=UPI001EF34B73|nr:HAMP domain-containing sensor histidine kinase [Cellulomonas sp. ACRRI]MCG7287889.1 HAMP domain-containing histidine kinase [Cellulomonas sp. ACRRI]